jgi:release factor glutamine methyltransferase
MQIKEAIKLAIEKFQNSATASLDARILLCKVLSLSYEQLLIKYNDILSENEIKQFFNFVERRAAMEPVAYIVGMQEFYGRDFIVNKNVLIPRPETELLIESLIENYNAHHLGKNIKILELGTGSGAISVSIASELRMTDILAVDISRKALDIAEINAHNHHVNKQINFIQSNWFSNVLADKFDYIISNPPYIAYNEQSDMALSTRLFEPSLALYAKDDGFASYIAIINSASSYLKDGGKIFFEIGYKQGSKVVEILKNCGFVDIVTKRDLAGHDRVIIARL